MSFWSSLNLVRTARPPIVSVAAIGHFIGKILATGALDGDEQTECEIKYGSRIDVDDKTTNVIDWDVSGYIGTTRDYPWDRSETFPTLAAMSDALRTDSRSVYRAFINLGSLQQDLVSAVSREASEENEEGLTLCNLSFNVGPVIVEVLEGDSQAMVGWMGLTFSGPGYFFPWDYRHARQRAESVILIRELTALCREAWPVPTSPISEQVVESRRQLASLWLYDDLAAPVDWLWFPSES